MTLPAPRSAMRLAVLCSLAVTLPLSCSGLTTANVASHFTLDAATDNSSGSTSTTKSTSGFAANITFPDDELLDVDAPVRRLEGVCTVELCTLHCRQQKFAAGRCDASKDRCVCRQFKQKRRCFVMGYGCGAIAYRNYNCGPSGCNAMWYPQPAPGPYLPAPYPQGPPSLPGNPPAGFQNYHGFPNSPGFQVHPNFPNVPGLPNSPVSTVPPPPSLNTEELPNPQSTQNPPVFSIPSMVSKPVQYLGPSAFSGVAGFGTGILNIGGGTNSNTFITTINKDKHNVIIDV